MGCYILNVITFHVWNFTVVVETLLNEESA